jgi:hypothetical protein
MSDDPLRAALLAALGKRPSIALRRQLAEQLRALADEREHLLAAESRQLAKPVAERLAPRSRGGGRPSTPWIRIERYERSLAYVDEVRVKLSRALYHAAHEPKRLDPQRIGADLCLISASGDAGYHVTITVGGIWINASGARDLLADLADGRYAAEMRAGMIVIGEPQ